MIEGVASYLLLDEAGAAKIRPTKDLDIVLIMKPTGDFLKALKEYIKLGGYEIQRGKREQATFYRFQKGKDEQFPIMIELFTAAQPQFEFFEGQHIIPITDSGGANSLSAVLLDDEYYEIIRKHAVEKDGVYIINEMALIPFKAKAYLEIKERGEDSKNWKKHRSDIINLAVTFLTESSKETLTGKVRKHFEDFMVQLRAELTSDIVTGACNQNIPIDTVIRLLEGTFL